MSGFYGSRAMEHWGVFAAFGGGGREIFGTFSFAESWSSDDFGGVTQFNESVKPYLSQVNRTDLTWVPPTSAVINAASANWALWQQAVTAEQTAGSSGAATSFTNDISSQMQDLIARTDALSLTGSLGHRSEANEVSRYDNFNTIKGIINKVAGSKNAAQTAMNNAAAVSAATVLPTAAASNLEAQSVASTTSPAIYGSSTGADTAAAPASDNTLLYIGLGVGALVLVGGGIFIVKKRRAPASATAGYRRRHGRRS